MTFTITEWRALLTRLSTLLVGGGTVTITVTAEPGTPDERKEPIAP